MSLDQYNTLMSGILNQWYALAKLKTVIEDRKKRVYWKYRKFRYLAYNCKNRKKKTKEKPISQNKFKMIANRMM